LLPSHLFLERLTCSAHPPLQDTDPKASLGALRTQPAIQRVTKQPISAEISLHYLLYNQVKQHLLFVVAWLALGGANGIYFKDVAKML
jgi:hypothetical protein